MSAQINSTSQNLYSFSSKIGTSMPLYTQWKGKTFRQIISAIQKNVRTKPTNIGNNIFRAQPLKIYRKEIATTSLSNPTIPRSGITIDEINRPGGTIVVNSYKPSNQVGLDGLYVEPKLTGNCMDHPGLCSSSTTNSQCAETNALRRCRSSGKVKQNYNSTSNQYLASRNKTFQQNQFNFYNSGNKLADPGSPLAQNNSYYAQGPQFAQFIYDNSGVLSTCSKMERPYTTVIYKPSNYKFSIQGAADAGALTLRRKFDTITNNTALYLKIYGNTVASAMSYGVSDTVYTDKGKIGYPIKKTPKFCKYSSTMKCL